MWADQWVDQLAEAMVVRMVGVKAGLWDASLVALTVVQSDVAMAAWSVVCWVER